MPNSEAQKIINKLKRNNKIVIIGFMILIAYYIYNIVYKDLDLWYLIIPCGLLILIPLNNSRIKQIQQTFNNE